MNAKRILACAALLLGLLSFNAPLHDDYHNARIQHGGCGI